MKRNTCFWRNQENKNHLQMFFWHFFVFIWHELISSCLPCIFMQKKENFHFYRVTKWVKWLSLRKLHFGVNIRKITFFRGWSLISVLYVSVIPNLTPWGHYFENIILQILELSVPQVVLCLKIEYITIACNRKHSNLSCHWL